MASQTNKVKVQKIDMDKPSYNKAASGENGLDAIIKNSVSYTNANQALKIYKAFLKTYEFNASSYDRWVEAVDEFIDDLSIAIRDGYEGIDGTKEEPDLSSLRGKMLATLSPTFKDQTPHNRTSKYDDVTIRSIMNYYKPSGDTQEQVSLIKASDVLIGETNVYSQKDEVVIPNKADDIVYSRATSSGINMSMATSPSKLVCIADEVYDANGAVIEEAEAETEYDDEQEELNVLARMRELYSDKEVTNEPIDMNVRTPVATSQDVLIPVANNCFVSSSDIVKSEEIADIKDVKEQMDDTLVHDDTVALDSGNADDTEGRWVEDHNIKIIPCKAGTEWRVVWDKDPVRMAEETPIPFDTSVFAGDGSVSKTEYDYGMKIVELPPAGVDMDSFGKAFEFIVYSRINTVSSLASNASIENPVPPAGQNAVGFYYNRHAARTLNFSFELHQQEYPELPLSYISNKLQELSRPYQYNDLHVEPKRCEIFLPGMSFQGYFSSVSCSLTGDLYTTWNDKPPVENTTGEQYSYGKLSVTMNFMIEEDIPLKQVKTDEKYALPVPDLPPSENSSNENLNNALEQMNLIGNPDTEMVKNLFKPISDFRIKDMQDVRNWLRELRAMIKANQDKMDTLDEDLSNVTNPNELQQFFLADRRTNGFMSQAIILFTGFEQGYLSGKFKDTTLLTDPFLIDNHYNYEDLFDGAYEKFKEVKPLANDFVDMEDYSAWTTIITGLGYTVAGVVSIVYGITIGIIVWTTRSVPALTYYITHSKEVTAYLSSLFASVQKSTRLPYESVIQAMTKLKSDVPLTGFLSEIAYMRPYLKKTNFSFTSDTLKSCVESTKITLPENSVLLEDGSMYVAYKGDNKLIVRPPLMYAALLYKALGRAIAESLNDTEYDLASLAQSDLVAQIKSSNKGYGNTDEVEKIHKELTNNGKDEYLANMIYNYRLMQNAYETITTLSVDFEALEIDNASELNKTYMGLKSDLTRWEKLVMGDHFNFNPGYICGIYERTEKFKNYSGKEFWDNVTLSQTFAAGGGAGAKGFDWVRLKSNRRSHFDLIFSNLLTKDATTGAWGYVPELVCEIPVKGELDDALARIDFSRYLRSTVENLHHNGSNGSYGTFEDVVAVRPKNNPYSDPWSNTFTENGRNIFDEELSKDNSVDDENIKKLKEGEYDYAFGLFFSTAWKEQDNRRWIDQYWNEPADDNYWSRDFVHATLAKFNAFMDELSGLTIKKDTKKTDKFAESLHTSLYVFGFVHDDKAISLKGVQESFYASKDNAIEMLTKMGLSRKTYSDTLLQNIGISTDTMVLDTITHNSTEFQKAMINATWGDILSSMMLASSTESKWYVKLFVEWQDKNNDTMQCLLSELFDGMNAQNPLDDQLFKRIWSWFYSYNGQTITETEITKYFKEHGYPYPYISEQ